MHLHRLLALSVAVGAVAVPAHGQADNDRRIGLVVTINVNVAADEAQQLSSELGEGIRTSLPVDVIAGEETVRRMPPDGLPEECIADSTCRNDVGRRLDADELLLLVIVRMGDVIQIDATWANIASGRTSSRPRIQVEPGADRKKLFGDAAAKLLPHIKKDTQETRLVVIERPDDSGRDTGRKMTLPAWIAVGVGGVATVGGTLFALSARSKFEDLESEDCQIQDCADEQARRDKGQRHALYADLLFGTAIAAGTTAVVFYLISAPDDTESPTTSVSAAAGPDSIGFVVRGSF